MAILEVRNLKVSYTASGPQILKGLDFEVDGDDFCAVIGPSGAGKSTLIRCINRLVEPTEGDIVLFGQSVRPLNGGDLRRLRRRIGMIFQEFNLVNRMSVMDNVLSGRLGYTGAFRSFFKAFPKEDIYRAASASALVSPARSCRSPKSCSSTNRPRRSTRRSRAT
jgi:phosphonate transport system ATP-binding protein